MFLMRDEATTKKRAIRRDLVSEGLLTLALAFVLAFVLFSFGTAGWFSNSDQASASSATITAKKNDYILLIDRTAVYDATSEGTPIYPGVAELKTLLRDGQGYSLTETSTEMAPKLAYELVNESSTSVEGQTQYFLMPGSYGTLTFYIEPRISGDLEADLLLDLGCYVNSYDEHDNLVISEVTNPNVLRFLQGHILFFTGRTGATYEDYRYTGLIEDGLIHFSSQNETKVPGEDYYQITLYWEWPLTYFEIDENMSTTAPAVTRKYPAELRTYINSNRDAFFAANINSNVTDLLNDGYNDADQIIGVNADYFVAFICNS